MRKIILGCIAAGLLLAVTGVVAVQYAIATATGQAMANMAKAPDVFVIR